MKHRKHRFYILSIIYKYKLRQSMFQILEIFLFALIDKQKWTYLSRIHLSPAREKNFG